MTGGELVFTQDISSGRVHKRYRMPGGQLASFEGCNLDEAGDYRIIPDQFGTGAYDHCQNCFPPVPTDQAFEQAARDEAG